MITKTPVRIIRNLLPVNFPRSKLNISQSVIEKNQFFSIIENEIIFEGFPINNNNQSCDLVKFNGFKVQNIEDQQRIELSKNVENVQILICIDFQNVDQSIIKETNGSQIIQIQNSSENPLTLLQNIPQTQAPFSVYLTKGNGIISCYECLAQNGKIKILMVSIIDDIEEHKQIPRENRGLEDYNGLNQSMEDSIQLEMVKYLKTFEINSEVAQFIEQIKIYQDQVLNVNKFQDKHDTS